MYNALVVSTDKYSRVSPGFMDSILLMTTLQLVTYKVDSHRCKH